jgi:hypothetical protein
VISFSWEQNRKRVQSLHHAKKQLVHRFTSLLIQTNLPAHKRDHSSGPYFKKLYAPGRNWTKPDRSFTLKETLLWRRLKFDGFQVLYDRLW